MIRRVDNSKLVVLVDEADKPIGTALKETVHGANTPLHRGLSVFLFDSKGRVLVQKRAEQKLTWPGVWSNSCCGHPIPGETYEEAARRIVNEELGLEVKDFKKVSDYRYRFERGGVVENEICPVYMGKALGEARIKTSEVSDFKFMEWEKFKKALNNDSKEEWSEWCKEEAELVEEVLSNEQ